jgi:2-isopropylmalate synthase
VALNEAFKRFKDLADKKKDVFDEDLIAIVDDEVIRTNDVIQFEDLEVVCGSAHRPPKATLTLNVEGTRKTVTSTGDGPVDSLFNAIKEIYPHEVVLQLYQVHAVTEGTDAQAEVSVRLEENGMTVNGQGADTDTMVASARAYVNALNKLLVKRQKAADTRKSA